MKITPKQYAQTLYEITKDKSQSEAEVILANFVKVLGKNNQLRLKNDIIKKFGEIYNKENSIVEAEVESKEKLYEDLRKQLRKYVSNKYDAKDVVLNEKRNESLKGGIIIRVGDEVLDGSVDRQLAGLKKVLTK